MADWVDGLAVTVEVANTVEVGRVVTVSVTIGMVRKIWSTDVVVADVSDRLTMLPRS